MNYWWKSYSDENTMTNSLSPTPVYALQLNGTTLGYAYSLSHAQNWLQAQVQERPYHRTASQIVIYDYWRVWGWQIRHVTNVYRWIRCDQMDSRVGHFFYRRCWLPLTHFTISRQPTIPDDSQWTLLS